MSESRFRSNPWSTKEFWESRIARGDMPWDMGIPSPTLVAYEQQIALPLHSLVIIPGCGLGHDAFYFASKGYRVSVVDWSETAVAEIRQRGRRLNLPLEVLCADFRAIPKSWESTFDFWVEHTFFCALDPSQRDDYVKQAVKMIKPSGHLIGAFFITPDESLLGKPIREESNGGPPFWSTEQEIRKRFEPFFKILTLEPSPDAHPARLGREWRAHFVKTT